MAGPKKIDTYSANDPRHPIPLQESAQFPFNLPADAFAYFKLQKLDNDRGTDLILPSGGTPDAPLYTLKWPTSKVVVNLHRNKNRKPDWYDAERPLSKFRVHTSMCYVNFEFNRADGSKVSAGGFTKKSIFNDKAFPWPADPDDDTQYGWYYPQVFQQGEIPWMFARLCRMKDKKTPDEEQPIAEVMIPDEEDRLNGERSYIRIPMREILGGGSSDETRLQRMDDIITVAIAFAAGKIQMAIDRRRNKSSSSSNNGFSSAVMASTSSVSC